MSHVLELRQIVKDFPGHRAVDNVTPRARTWRFLLASRPPPDAARPPRFVWWERLPRTTHLGATSLLAGAAVNALKPWQRRRPRLFSPKLRPLPAPHRARQRGVRLAAKRGTADRTTRALRALDLVQLADKRDRMPAQLSGVERNSASRWPVRWYSSRNCSSLDEPLAALDPQLRKQMRAELKAMQRKTGITFLFVTHDQEEALSLSDKLAVMHQGRIEQFGTPEDVYLRPATAFVAGFLGAINWFDKAGVRPESTRRRAREARRVTLPPRRRRKLALPRQLHPPQRDA